MGIREIKENKKQFLLLLLLADEGNGILELKNIATAPEHQGKGHVRFVLFDGRTLKAYDDAIFKLCVKER